MGEVSILERNEGMLLKMPNNSNFRIRGTKVNLCADSKGAHEIKGFL